MAKVKNFFIKVGRWFKNHAPTKRRLIQIYTALLYNANIKGFVTGKIYQGNTKKACVPGLNCYSCPGAVGACPLGALQDSLANSGTTTPYYILGILGLFGLTLARTICGFFCPVGLGQELLYKIKTPKLKKSRYTRIASYFKYVLLVVLVIAIPLIYHAVPAFCQYVCPAGTFGGTGGLLINPSNGNLGNPVENLFDQLGFLFTWKFMLLVIIIIASVFIYRFFCRFICPLGAIYGFFNKIALLGVKLDKSKCVDCGMCIEKCKMDIKHVGDHECINCGECIPVCPTKAISWKGSKLILAGIDTSVTDNPEEVAPLAVKVSGGNVQTVQAEASGNVQTAQTEISGGNAAVTVVLPEEPEKAVETREDKVKAVETRIKRRSFWLQITAWALALTVLVCAFVFYNLPDKEVNEGQTVYRVGDISPDFEFGTIYESEGSLLENGERLQDLKLSDFSGKVTVLNFWYTTCGSCIAEMPDFAKAKADYGDDINVVVIHINDNTDDSGVQSTINGLGWNDWDLIFVHDTQELIFNKLGGGAACPRTVIIDGEGKITFTFTGSLSGKFKDDIPRLDYEIISAIGK